MHLARRFSRAVSFAVLGFTGLVSACSDQAFFTSPSLQVQSSQNFQAGIAAAIAAQQRHYPELHRIAGVVGTAVGLGTDGRPVVQVFLETGGVAGLPDALDGIPVQRIVTGRIMARSDPTLRARPAPLGYSVGHPSITAGSIGARVSNGSGSVFALSNNHVLANSNDATLGDPALQPGPYDGGTSADQIGTLYGFKPIDFSGANNTFDAAIAISNTGNLGNATPTDDGYGTPSSAIWGDANNDKVFDNKNALLGLHVQKFGRTTKLTKGTITGINGIVDVCYEVLFIFCVKSAHYVDQLIIGQASFSGGGDSGSLIVTDDADKHPVALLFAGSDTETIANRIDLVLNYFAVTVDGGAAPPPPANDVATTNVSAPAAVTQGSTVNVTVTVQNLGTNSVAGSFDVSLRDATDNLTIGTQTVAGLAVGASSTLTFSWNTSGSSAGSHTLTGSHNLVDDNAANNQASTTSSVNPPSVNIHIGDLDGIASADSPTSWSATVEVTVHDANHQPLNGATVVGSWSRTGLNSNTCTTGDLGGNGTCIMLFPGLSRKSVKSVSFTVNSVTMVGMTYLSSANHDVDGSSNGTTVKVNRP